MVLSLILLDVFSFYCIFPYLKQLSQMIVGFTD